MISPCLAQTKVGRWIDYHFPMRNLQRWVEEILEDVERVTNQHPHVYKQRRYGVEHSYEVIKRNL